MAELLSKRLKVWRGTRNARAAATALGIPLETYRKYEWGKRTPNALALAELERRMAETVQTETQ